MHFPLTQSIKISIHAPVKGATAFSRHGDTNIDFNPRSREGSDLEFRILLCLRINFNPRSREGSDGDHMQLPILADLFQSTLP